MSVKGDTPIETVADDTLLREKSAKAFVTQTLNYELDKGLVVGVLGPWGSGKSSYINLARPHFKAAGAKMLTFNPWMFSGADQLVDSFFIEVSAQLKLQGMNEIGKYMAEYGEAFAGLGWIPIVGPWIERVRGVNKIISTVMQRRSEGTAEQRSRLELELKKLSNPVVVVLDDIDRLTTTEIRDVFRLVRLTASFPNLIYVVAFDRKRVEQALEESNVPGRDYLEKILQYALDIPEIPHETLRRETLDALNAQLVDVSWVNEADGASWSDKFNGVVAPLIRNMRDVRRFTAAAAGAAQTLDGEVALSDVLTLEAVRVFMPDLYAVLHPFAEVLTQGGSGIYQGSMASDKRQELLVPLIESLGDRGHIASALLRTVFPAAGSVVNGNPMDSAWSKVWLKNRNVAHHAVLSLYLERVSGSKLATFGQAETLFAVLADEDAATMVLEAVTPADRADVIADLGSFEDDFHLDHVVPGVATLLNFSRKVPDPPAGMFSFGKTPVIRRIVLRLLRAAGGAEEIEAAVDLILPRLKGLTAAGELLSLIGHRKDEGTAVVGEAFAAEREQVWMDSVRASDADALSGEESPLRIILMVNRWSGTENPIELPDDASLTLALMRDALSNMTSQTMGSSHVEVTPTLYWDALVDVFGDENTLKSRGEMARGASTAGDKELFELFDKYAAGWKPKEL